MYFFILTLLLPVLSLNAQPATEEKAILGLVEDFFHALEKQDTTALQNMFMKDARNYAVREMKDSVVVRGMLPSDFRFKPEQILKERMRQESTIVKIEGRIAIVWAPYDLWVNDTFSHCGVDVFTLIRTSAGWKIASISYTVEPNGCQ